MEINTLINTINTLLILLLLILIDNIITLISLFHHASFFIAYYFSSSFLSYYAIYSFVNISFHHFFFDIICFSFLCYDTFHWLLIFSSLLFRLFSDRIRRLRHAFAIAIIFTLIILLIID